MWSVAEIISDTAALWMRNYEILNTNIHWWIMGKIIVSKGHDLSSGVRIVNTQVVTSDSIIGKVFHPWRLIIIINLSCIISASLNA